ncbi:MAG: hypothetical protein ACE5L7_00840 [Candidatus Aminicenantales bacterium]
MMKRKILILLLIAFLLHGAAWCVTKQAVPGEKPQEKQVEKEGKRIIPSPKNIKEKTGIFVFIGWMWISIIVLIFILKAKIREVDRLYLIRFFSSRKKKSSRR